jgi:hypothetical protein
MSSGTYAGGVKKLWRRPTSKGVVDGEGVTQRAESLIGSLLDRKECQSRRPRSAAEGERPHRSKQGKSGISVPNSTTIDICITIPSWRTTVAASRSDGLVGRLGMIVTGAPALP